MTTPAASKKDRHGNRTYAIPHPETRQLVELPSWTRLKSLMYSGALETWKLKKVAAAVAMSTALQMESANPETVYKAVQKALDADTEKADVGTYVHRYTEQIDAGTLEWEFVPPAAEPFVRAYEKLKAEWAWETIEAEVTIYNLLLGYAGSADRFARFPGLPAHLGLHAPTFDVFALDIKTGKVWPEVALQLGAYANGEGIFEAPSKVDLGFAAREAQLEDDIRSGVGYDRINPNRRKWSDDAIREARADLEAEWWTEYAIHGRHRPMPKGLRKDVGLVVELHDDGARLIPVRIDGRAAQDVVPAMHVIDGLSALYRWGRRKDIIGEAVDRAAPYVPKPLDYLPAVPPAGPAPEPAPEPQSEPQPAPATETQALEALDRAGMLDGADIGDGDLDATDADKQHALEWLADIAANRKHLLPALRASLDREGLTKKLRQDTWTLGELRRWSNCAIAVERSAL